MRWVWHYKLPMSRGNLETAGVVAQAAKCLTDDSWGLKSGAARSWCHVLTFGKSSSFAAARFVSQTDCVPPATQNPTNIWGKEVFGEQPGLQRSATEGSWGLKNKSACCLHEVRILLLLHSINPNCRLCPEGVCHLVLAHSPTCHTANLQFCAHLSFPWSF